MENPLQTAEEYLHKGKLMQLATVHNGKPWICTVNYVHDQTHNLYWISMRNSRHSVELAREQTIAVAVVADPITKQGLQMEGTACEVTGADVTRVHRLYAAKYEDKPERLAEARSSAPDKRAYYKFVPRSIKIVDITNAPGNPGQILL